MLYIVVICSILLLETSTGPITDSPACVRYSSVEVADACGVSFWSDTMGCVYVAMNKINGKQYVGKTCGKMNERKDGHEREAQKGSKIVFHWALVKYGFAAFEWKVLIKECDKEELCNLEKATIKLFNTKAPNGYNLTDGGEGTSGFKQSLDSINKRIKKTMGKKRTIEQRENIRRGHLNSPVFYKAMRSESRRQKLRNAYKDGRLRLSEKFKKEAAKARKGCFHSIEAKQKMSESTKKWWQNDDNRKKMCEVRVGKPWSKKRRDAYLKSIVGH